MSSERIELRHLSSDDDYEQCVAIQQLTWGRGFAELVPPGILMITRKVGGIVAGAFDERGQMLAFVFGMTGIREGRLAHWSHMLAAVPAARGLGLGKELKLFQRRELVALGVEVMFWTYDPLVARNANLNLNRLGARPREYVRDMYGDDTGSVMHSGLGTDRFVVAWELADPAVARHLEEADRGRDRGHERPTAEVTSLQRVTTSGDRAVLPDGDLFYVEIPTDIDAEREASLERAQQWRRDTRAGLEAGLAAGFAVTGLVWSPDFARCFYRLERPG